MGLLALLSRRFTQHGRRTNKYGFKGLIAKASPSALEKIAGIEQGELQGARNTTPAILLLRN
jgi:hypothetical protein